MGSTASGRFERMQSMIWHVPELPWETGPCLRIIKPHTSQHTSILHDHGLLPRTCLDNWHGLSGVFLK